MRQLPLLFAGRAALQLVVFVLLAAAMAVPAAAGDTKYAEGIFWKVQRDGGPESFVLGVVHSTDPRLRELPEQIRQPFVSARDVVFELPQDPEGAAAFSSAMMLQGDIGLERILGDALFGSVSQAALRYGLNPQALRGLQPWALGTFLAFSPTEFARLRSGAQVFDDWLMDTAQRRGKAVHGLESYQERIAFFDSMSQADQVVMVTDLVADNAKIEAQQARVLNAYLKSELGNVFTLLTDMSGVNDEQAARKFLQRLIFDRNAIMATRMEPFLRRGNTFVAIGALHLPGEAGVLDLLERQGYRITRVY